jgi:thioredoxin-related protein
MTKKTFSKDEVGEFFNKSFVNVAINGETTTGQVIIANYDVRAYPTLLFIDKNGNLIKGAEGYHSVKTLLNLGMTVLK